MKINISVCTSGDIEKLDTFIKSYLSIKPDERIGVKLTLIVNQKIFDKKRYPSFIRFRLEPKKGFASVRNRALRSNPPNHNLIFIDDDQIVNQEWLREIRRFSAIYPGEILSGPVLPINENNRSSYRAQIWHEMQKIKPYSSVSKAASNNLLIPPKVLNDPHCMFDEFFNSGGEDTDLTMRLTQNGFIIRWIPTAIVHEIESLERFSQQWIQNRILKDYQNYAIAFRRNNSSFLNLIQFYRFIGNILICFVFSFFNKKFALKLLGNSYALRAFVSGKWKF